MREDWTIEQESVYLEEAADAPQPRTLAQPEQAAPLLRQGLGLRQLLGLGQPRHRGSQREGGDQRGGRGGAEAGQGRGRGLRCWGRGRGPGAGPAAGEVHQQRLEPGDEAAQLLECVRGAALAPVPARPRQVRVDQRRQHEREGPGRRPGGGGHQHLDSRAQTGHNTAGNIPALSACGGGLPAAAPWRTRRTRGSGG